MNSFTEIIDQWPSLSALARDLGCTRQNVSNMRKVNLIPAHHWEKLLAAARRREINGFDLETLARLSAARAA